MAERRSPWKKVSRAITRPAATEVRMPYFRAFFARIGLPAPMFWATKEDMDCI